MKSRFRSSIPDSARERIKKRYPSGAKEISDYFVSRRLVGRRFFNKEGYVQMECGIKNGHMHGMMYTWSSRDDLHSAEPYRNGLAHGTALQWSQRNPNRIIGKYTMKRGTGIDLWWQDWPFRLHLSEVFYLKEGQPHGFEWWIRENQKALWHERHWKNGKFHGIERQWNNKGKLHRGYPKYFVEGTQLTKSKYIAVCRNDETLPLFRKADNDPKRIFPPEIRKHLKYKRRSHLRK